MTRFRKSSVYRTYFWHQFLLCLGLVVVVYALPHYMISVFDLNSISSWITVLGASALWLLSVRFSIKEYCFVKVAGKILDKFPPNSSEVDVDTDELVKELLQEHGFNVEKP